jgi:arylsulfatase A-like enzyme
VRVPLIVHLPAWLASQRPEDLDAVRLSTDITPTIYAALGYQPRRANAMMGRPFIGEDAQTLAERRRETDVLAASYGAVYAALSQNGRRLYIADAINGVEYEYERQPAGDWTRVDVTEDRRTESQLAIRRYVDTLATMYRVPPRL